MWDDSFCISLNYSRIRLDSCTQRLYRAGHNRKLAQSSIYGLVFDVASECVFRFVGLYLDVVFVLFEVEGVQEWRDTDPKRATNVNQIKIRCERDDLSSSWPDLSRGCSGG